MNITVTNQWEMYSYQRESWLQEFTDSPHLSLAAHWIGGLCSSDRSCWTCLCLSCAAWRGMDLKTSWTPSCGAEWRSAGWAPGCSPPEVPDDCRTSYPCAFYWLHDVFGEENSTFLINIICRHDINDCSQFSAGLELIDWFLIDWVLFCQ